VLWLQKKITTKQKDLGKKKKKKNNNNNKQTNRRNTSE